MRFYLIACCLGVWLLQQQATLPPARWLWLLPLLGTALWLPRFSRLVPEVLRRIGGCAAVRRARFCLGGLARRSAAGRSPARSLAGCRYQRRRRGERFAASDARGERFVLDVEQVVTPGAPTLQRIQLARYWPRNAPSHTPTVQAGERWQLHGAAEDSLRHAQSARLRSRGLDAGTRHRRLGLCARAARAAAPGCARGHPLRLDRRHPRRHPPANHELRWATRRMPA